MFSLHISMESLTRYFRSNARRKPLSPSTDVFILTITLLAEPYLEHPSDKFLSVAFAANLEH